MIVEQQAEVRLAQPRVHVLADFDADAGRNRFGDSEPRREKDLPEPPLSDQPSQVVAQLRLGAGQDVAG